VAPLRSCYVEVEGRVTRCLISALFVHRVLLTAASNRNKTIRIADNFPCHFDQQTWRAFNWSLLARNCRGGATSCTSRLFFETEDGQISEERISAQPHRCPATKDTSARWSDFYVVCRIKFGNIEWLN